MAAGRPEGRARSVSNPSLSTNFTIPSYPPAVCGISNMIKNYLASVVLLFSSMLSLPLSAGETNEMTPQELHDLIQSGKSPVIVDVRSGLEYRAGHVPGAVHVPFWSALWRTDEIPKSGQAPVVVYCAHGPRASLAGWALKLAGITNVVHMKGHMTGWHRLRLPEVKGENPNP